MRNLVKLLVVAAIGLGAATLPASAGGPFGKGGLIRGSVGNFIAKNVQRPVLTPLARGATVAAGTALGAAGGAYVGMPATGAAVGGAVGQGVNNIAAGKRY
jgi:hypothetical protein